MKYKFNYENKFHSIVQFAYMYYFFIILDITITAIIDAIMFIPFTVFTGEIYMYLESVPEVPKEYTYSLCKIVLVLELLFIVIVEFKRRITFCQLKGNGVLIYNNCFQKFGYGSFVKRCATVPYNQIELCYKAIPTGCPKTYRYQYYYPLSSLKKKIAKDTSYRYIPPIAHGAYDSECVILQLHNKKIVPLPIDDCDGFIEEFKRWCAITNNSKK